MPGSPYRPSAREQIPVTVNAQDDSPRNNLGKGLIFMHICRHEGAVSSTR